MLTDRITGAAIHPAAPSAAERGIPYVDMDIVYGINALETCWKHGGKILSTDLARAVSRVQDLAAILDGLDPQATADQFTMFGAIRQMRRDIPTEWRAAFARRVLALDPIGCYRAEAQRIAGLPVTAPDVEVLYRGKDVTTFANGTIAIDQAPYWYYGAWADAPKRFDAVQVDGISGGYLIPGRGWPGVKLAA